MRLPIFRAPTSLHYLLVYANPENPSNILVNVESRNLCALPSICTARTRCSRAQVFFTNKRSQKCGLHAPALVRRVAIPRNHYLPNIQQESSMDPRFDTLQIPRRWRAPIPATRRTPRRPILPDHRLCVSATRITPRHSLTARGRLYLFASDKPHR